MRLKDRTAAIEAARAAYCYFTTERNLLASLGFLNTESDIDTPRPDDFKSRQYTFKFGNRIMQIVKSIGVIEEAAKSEGNFGFIGSDFTDNWSLGPEPRCALTGLVSKLAFADLFVLSPKMQLFIPESKTFDSESRINVVTSYPNSLYRYAIANGVQLGKVKRVDGKAEGYVGRDDVGAGFDIVESGDTLRANGLWVPDQLKNAGLELKVKGAWRIR